MQEDDDWLGSSSECRKHLSQEEICFAALSVHTSTDLHTKHSIFFFFFD